MPASGIGFPILLVVQAPISAFVYSEAKTYGSRAPLLVGIAVFVLGIALAFVFNTAIGVVAAELLVILVYWLGVHAAT